MLSNVKYYLLKMVSSILCRMPYKNILAIDKNLFAIEIFYFNIFLLLFSVKYATDLFYHLILRFATKPVMQGRLKKEYA